MNRTESRLSRPGRPHRTGLGGTLLTAAAMAALLAPVLLVASCGSSSRAQAVRDYNAGSAASGPLKPSGPRDGGPGLQLLEEAARAGSSVSYRGVEMVSAMGTSGNTTTVADVWHRSGGSTLVQTTSGGAAGSGPGVSDDTDSAAPEGVLGLTGQLVALLGTNYDLAYLGTGSADSRPAQIVEAVREDGTLAARFWLDQSTKLPLRREVFDASAHLIGEDVIIDLKLGEAAAAGPPAAAVPPASTLTAVDVSQMRARGWPVPGSLPDGLSMFEAGETTTSSGPVLDLGFSDGLYVVSVFIQRGNLAAKLTGWRRTTVDGRDVWIGDSGRRSLAWSGSGFVFTVMADAPSATLDKAVGALPYDPPPGFWSRVSRGFGRIASIADPFR